MVSDVGERQKRVRTRTGCFTCRKRRIKCDETKPTCGRCKKSLRHCYYASLVELSTEIQLDQESTKEDVLITNQLAAVPELYPTESSDADESATQDVTVVRVSPVSSDYTHDTATPQLNSPQLFEDSNFNAMDLLFDVSNPPMGISTIVNPFECFEDRPFQLLSSTCFRPQTIIVPRSPESNRHHLVDFFLKYHLEVISPGHYFLYYDYIQLCKCWLPAMAATSLALRHALVAFSALVYSIKEAGMARQVAFYYYAMALKELRQFLEGPSSPEECNVAIAAALQLSSFERFLGDTGKAFSHLNGAAYIMQTRSDPFKMCSTTLGRSLLEWYCMFEDHCAFGSAAAVLLPKYWRHENCRTRRKLADTESPRVSNAERRKRLLDDLWPQFYSKVTNIADVLTGLPSLRDLDSSSRSNAIYDLKTQLEMVRQDFKDFVQSPDVIDILQPSEHPSDFVCKESLCCHLAPDDFAPHFLQFPAAANFRLIILSVQIYIRSVIYPLLCDEEFEDNDGRFDAYELCQTFAGLECVSGGNLDDLLPSFGLLITAGLDCPLELRTWLWNKLVHFEVCGPFSKPIIKALSIYHKMPLTEYFNVVNNSTSEIQPRVVDADELVDLATIIKEINLAENSCS